MSCLDSSTSRPLDCLQVDKLLLLQVLHQDQTLLLRLGHQHAAAAEKGPSKQAPIQLLILGIIGSLFWILDPLETIIFSLEMILVKRGVGGSGRAAMTDRQSAGIAKLKKIVNLHFVCLLCFLWFLPDSCMWHDAQRASSRARQSSGADSPASRAQGKRHCTRRPRDRRRTYPRWPTWRTWMRVKSWSPDESSVVFHNLPLLRWQQSSSSQSRIYH